MIKSRKWFETAELDEIAAALGEAGYSFKDVLHAMQRTMADPQVTDEKKGDSIWREIEGMIEDAYEGIAPLTGTFEWKPEDWRACPRCAGECSRDGRNCSYCGGTGQCFKGEALHA